MLFYDLDEIETYILGIQSDPLNLLVRVSPPDVLGRVSPVRNRMAVPNDFVDPMQVAMTVGGQVCNAKDPKDEPKLG